MALALSNNWRYISIVHTDDAFGTNGARGFQAEAVRQGVCIAAMISLPPSGRFINVTQRETRYRLSFDTLLRSSSERGGGNNSKAKVVLMWMVSVEATHWLAVANGDERMRAAGLTFLAVSGWSQSSGAIKNVDIARGAIGVFAQTPTNSSQALADHFEQLSLSQRGINPWLRRVYSEFYGCNVSDDSEACTQQTLGELHRSSNSPKSLRDSLVVYLPRFVDGVFALAHAINSTLQALCERRDCTKSQALQLLAANRDAFHRELRDVRFVNPLTGTLVGFVSGNPLTGGLYRFTNAVASATDASSEGNATPTVDSSSTASPEMTPRDVG